MNTANFWGHNITWDCSLVQKNAPVLSLTDLGLEVASIRLAHQAPSFVHCAPPPLAESR